MYTAPPKPAWYILYGYPGQETKLRDNLRKRLGDAGFQNQLYDILLPLRECESLALTKNGLVKTIYPVLFPGTVFVLAAMSRQIWDIIRQTPGLTGFYGSGNQPLSYPAADNLDLSQSDKAEPPVTKGRLVRIVKGPFRDFPGMVFGVDAQRSRLRVMIDFHQRPTPLDLGFEEVAQLK